MSSFQKPAAAQCSIAYDAPAAVDSSSALYHAISASQKSSVEGRPWQRFPIAPLQAQRLREGPAIRSARRRSETYRPRPCPRRERDAELVHQDLFSGAVTLQIRRVDALAQLGLDEEMAEDRKLDREIP